MRGVIGVEAEAGRRARVWVTVLGALALGGAACDEARDVIDHLVKQGHDHDHGGGDHSGSTGGAVGMAGAGGAVGAGGAMGAGGSCDTPDSGAACVVPGCGAGGDLPPGFNLSGVWIGPAGEVWAVGAGGYVGRRAPESGAWCWCAPLPADLLTGVWGAASDDVFAVAAGGAILRFDGTRWLSYRPVPAGLNGVHGSGRDNVWAVGERGWTARFDGTSWQTGIVDPKYRLEAVWVDPAGTVRVAGSAPLPPGEPGASYTVEAVVLRQPAAAPANDWTLEASFPQRGSASFYEISGSSASDIWAVGNNLPSGAATSAQGFVAHFDGSIWTPARTEPDILFEAKVVVDVVAASPDGGAAWFLDGAEGVRFDGTTWAVVPELARTRAIDARDGVMYAVGDSGLVLRWSVATGWVVDRASVAPPAVPVP